MSKIYIPVLFLLLSLSVPVQAEENTTPPARGDFLGGLLEKRQEHKEERFEKREDAREHFEERRDEMKENIAERRAHFASTTALRKANLAEHVKEFVLKRAEHIASLLDAMIERLTKLSERIQARIDTLEERGVDVSDAKNALANAESKINEAETAVETLKEAVADALNSETPRESLKEVKPLGETTKTAIREAHTALVEAIKTLPNAQHEGESEENDSENN